MPSTDTIADWVQIAFWLTVGTLGILTYRQARRTVLQPIRTEIFKRQLDLLNDVLASYSGLGESDLRTKFGIPDLIGLNLRNMFLTYGWWAFNVAPTEEARRKYREEVAVSIVPADMLEAVNDSFNPQAGNPAEGPSADKPVEWSYAARLVDLPPAFVEEKARLEAFRDSALAPTNLVTHLQQLDDALTEFTKQLRPAIEAAAAEMQRRYPTEADFRKSSMDWANNVVNAKIDVRIRDRVADVVSYCRGYFNSDDLVKL